MKIASAQISCVPGDIDANVCKIREFASRAKEAAADIVVFPETADTGYSMAAIQKHATPFSEGAVPQLQAMAKSL
ncbi:MAG TPA: nitrilase-related carbon-nitrogen hydrolase, partial [Chthoniobacterales bacterium]